MLKKYPVKVKDDPLNFMVIHHQFLFNNKVLSPLIRISFALAAIVNISASIYRIITEGLNNFLIYHALGFFLGSYVLSNLSVEYIHLGSAAAEKIDSKWYWDIATSCPSSQDKINKEIRRVFITYAIITITTFNGAIFNFIIECFTDVDFLCDKYLITLWFAGNQKLKFLLTFLLSSTHFLITLTIPSQYLAIKYSTMTLKIQLDVLVDFLNQIELYHSTEDLKIREHLRICIIHHISITKLLQMIQGLANLPILFLPISGIFAILGCLVYIYYNNSTIVTVGLLIQLSLGGLFVVDMCNSGQDVEDSFDQFFNNLMKLKWYQWNESNKKSLLVMMARSQRSATIQAFTVQVNRRLIIRFHFGYHEKVLIDQWHIQNVGGLVGSMVGIMVIAIIYEGLKYVREHLSKHNARSSVQTTILSQMHCVQTILHLIQLTLSYLLMLIFMTYNAWLCIAVVLGSTIGYFLVGWKRTGIVDTTEHCQ